MTKTITFTSYSGNDKTFECVTPEDFDNSAYGKNTTFAIETNKAARKKGETPFYLEIGASHYKDKNDTYDLEMAGWKGISIEIEKRFVDDFGQNRSNPCILGDAIKVDWDLILDQYDAPKRIDFLQIDIDMNPRNANLLALINLPLSRYRFNSIIIEHSVGMDYTFENLRSTQRYILTSLGYRLVNSGHYDDWWVDKTVFDVMQTVDLSTLK